MAEDARAPSPDPQAEIRRLTLQIGAQERYVGDLEVTIANLRHALEARVVIDRAIGMLAERFHLTPREAFELLRSAARTSRRKVRSLSEEITDSRESTPGEITDVRKELPDDPRARKPRSQSPESSPVASSLRSREGGRHG